MFFSLISNYRGVVIWKPARSRAFELLNPSKLNHLTYIALSLVCEGDL